MFAKSCGFNPDPYQADALISKERRRLFLWGRRCGKTATCAILALWTAMFRKDSSVIIISPTLPQSKEMLREVRFWYTKYAEHHPKSKYISCERMRTDEVVFTHGGRILCRPATSASIKGYGADLLIVDEAARVPDQLLTQDITPFLATTGGSIILISTPWSIGNAFHKAYTTSLQDPPLWKLYGPVRSDQCSRVDLNYLAEEKQWLPKMWYEQEYEAKWVNALSNVFDLEHLQKAFMPRLAQPTTEGVVIGVDLAKINDFTVFTALNKNGEVCGLEEYQKLPYPDVVERLRVFSERQHATRILVDETGLGSAVMDWIARSKLKGMVDGYTIGGTQKKLDLVNNLRNAFEKRTVHIPSVDSHYLARKQFTQLMMFRYTETEHSHVLMAEAPEGEHDDYVMSLALACWLQRPGGRIKLLGGMDNY
jgi:hypothetical protein